MLLLFIFLILGILLAEFVVYKMGIDEEEAAMTFFFIVALSVGIWAGTCAISQLYLERETVETNRVEIYSIGNQTGVEGSFIFGSGHIDSEMYYFYYEKGDYGYIIKKIKSQDVEIVERDDEEPIGYIVTYDNVPKQENWFIAFGKKVFSNLSKTVIYLPKNSITISYSISV